MLNTISAIGRLTRNPEVKYTAGSQMAICRFTLAVDRPTGKDKEKVTDFLPCIIMGKAAENMEKYTEKGKQVAVEGRLQSGSYQKDGQTIYTLDVFCSKVHFLEWKDKGYAAGGFDQAPAGFSSVNERIPF